MLLYYITDRKQFSGDEVVRRRHLLAKISEASRCGVHHIQLREKDLSGRELESLARESLHEIQLATGNREPRTALLINSRTDLAIAVGADGVHLRSEDVSPSAVRALWEQRRDGIRVRPLVAVSCHSEQEVVAAESENADFAVFAPVFEKKDAPGVPPAGLARLRQACRHGIPVLALGGITLKNARSCLEAGAAGIAGIRLFQENEIREVIQRLR